MINSHSFWRSEILGQPVWVILAQGSSWGLRGVISWGCGRSQAWPCCNIHFKVANVAVGRKFQFLTMWASPEDYPQSMAARFPMSSHLRQRTHPRWKAQSPDEWTPEAAFYHFCHMQFVVSGSLGPAHTQEEEDQAPSFKGRSMKASVDLSSKPSQQHWRHPKPINSTQHPFQLRLLHHVRSRDTVRLRYSENKQLL